MRLSNLIPALVSVATVLASPLVDVEETTLSLDRSKEMLDSGRIALHLTRIDDLLDDEDDMKPLLERITHIGLTIQLDVNEGTLSVNGETLPMLLPEGEGISVTVVKAEAYSMPLDLPAAFYTPEHVQALANAMSTGIASVSVRLDSEIVPVDALGSVNAQDESVSILPVEGVQLRKLGLFVTVNEVEGTSFAHSRIVYAPILQLLVTAENIDGTASVKQISTLSVGGEPVVAEAIHSPDYLTDVSDMLPPVEEEADDKPQQLWSGLRAPASGIWAALESIFGQPKYEHSDVYKKRPAFSNGGRKGLALGPDAPQFDDGLYSEDESAQPPKHMLMKGGHCFWKRFSKGFLFIFGAIGYAFTQTAPGLLLLGMMMAAVTFHAARRLVKRRRCCQHEQLPQYEGDLPTEYRDEKPPTYVEPIPQTNLTIFDADKEDAADEKAH